MGSKDITISKVNKMILKLIVLAIFYISVIFGQATDCHIPGDINGIIIGSEDVVDYHHCLKKCKDDTYCQYFTYYDYIKACAHFLNATSIDRTCTTCFSGSRDCEIPEPICDVPGRCIGELVQLIPTSSEGQCLGYCKEEWQCEW